MGEVIKDLNHCPFCNIEFPKGPAYFCPKCGKRLDEEFSKRSFFDEDLNNSSEESYVDYVNIENSLDNEDDSNLVEEMDLDDKSVSEDVIIDDEISIVDEEGVIIDDEVSIVDNEKEIISSDINTDLFNINKKLKLDLFLEHCVDEDFLKNILKSINEEYCDIKSATSKIMNSLEFEDILKFIDNFSNSANYNKSVNLLNNAFENLAVIKVILLAKNYDIPIAGNKESLINNFVDKFSFDDLCAILEKNNLPVLKDLDIENPKKTILEQIYVLDVGALEEYSRLMYYKGERSRILIIEYILSYLTDEYLLCDEIFNQSNLILEVTKNGF